MNSKTTHPHVIGIDFGTDSVRSIVVNAKNGEILSSAVEYYRRWSQLHYCDPMSNQFRQHPRDYLDSMTQAVQTALSDAPYSCSSLICGISVDTTGSTPVAVDSRGTPLALTPGFEDNPNAMFILWKDHTATSEADEINSLCKSYKTDYSKFVGGIYSSEWFWAKILKILRIDESVRKAAYSWVEHCDWIPFLLTGGTDVQQMMRSRCAAGHKAMWHEDFKGLPPNDFFANLDPLLDGLRNRMYTQTYTSDCPAGSLSHEWAEKLGLNTDVVVGVGAFDAHMGAVGGQIESFYLSKVMGTSTCDMLVAPYQSIGDNLIQGICGQVDGSIIPGMIGLEAGQSAFGDSYAWFKDVLMWPVSGLIENTKILEPDLKRQLMQELAEKLIPELTKLAEKTDPATSSILALDWLNGRRTPDANQSLKAVITGLTLGSDAPKIFRAIVESTCFGARKIVDRFQQEGVTIKGIIGMGGVAKNSPFVMQCMADILKRPIRICRSEQTCALGAAMFAATVSGIYENVSIAMSAMGGGFDKEYHPNPDRADLYDKLYGDYCKLGKIIEHQFS